MTYRRITKRTVDATFQPNGGKFTVWDDTVTGFGVRVRPTGAKSYVVVYRAGAGRSAPVRRYTIAAVGRITPERARTRAKVILGAVAHGHDPANQKTTERGTPTVAELADRFMAEHVRSQAQGPDRRLLQRHTGPNCEASSGHYKGRQAEPAPSWQAAFIPGGDTLPG